MILGNQPEDLAALADHDFRVERESARELCAEPRLRHRPPDHERAGCPDVDDIEVLQFLRERGGPEGPVTADIHASQKDDECHNLTESPTEMTPVRTTVP
jgi:hypothetical protein